MMSMISSVVRLKNDGPLLQCVKQGLPMSMCNDEYQHGMDVKIPCRQHGHEQSVYKISHCA